MSAWQFVCSKHCSTTTTQTSLLLWFPVLMAPVNGTSAKKREAEWPNLRFNQNAIVLLWLLLKKGRLSGLIYVLTSNHHQKAFLLVTCMDMILKQILLLTDVPKKNHRPLPIAPENEGKRLHHRPLPIAPENEGKRLHRKLLEKDCKKPSCHNSLCLKAQFALHVKILVDDCQTWLYAAAKIVAGSRFFCLSCATSIHSNRNLFHVLEILNVSFAYLVLIFLLPLASTHD